ncbi:MAG: EndoU domain-containing protein, partial [Pseudomonadota bacterium]|nr:EndoU domain-containing protein [Pseudomonadota bacterium]
PKLPDSMRYEFEAILSPNSLAIMAGTLVVWAGSHAFGVGQAVDVVLLVGGAVFLGMAVFDVAGELSDFLVVTCNAADENDLDEAASHLARAIAIMGVATFTALLAKIARGRGRKGGTAEAPLQPAQKPAHAKPQAAPEAGPEQPSSAKTQSAPKAKLPTKMAGHRREHILNRHRYGSNKPNKTEFPKEWSDDDIIRNVESVANDPNAIPVKNKYGSSVVGTRDGVEIRVDFYPDNHPAYPGRISTAYPLNVPANPSKATP